MRYYDIKILKLLAENLNQDFCKHDINLALGLDKKKKNKTEMIGRRMTELIFIGKAKEGKMSGCSLVKFKHRHIRAGEVSILKDIKKHEMEERRKMEEELKCEKCGKTYLYKGFLENHQESCTGEKKVAKRKTRKVRENSDEQDMSIEQLLTEIDSRTDEIREKLKKWKQMIE